MRTLKIGLTAAALVLSGCNLGGDPTDSAFSTPDASGTLNKATGGRSGSDTSSVTGNTYGYQVGAVTDDGLQGFAGTARGASVTPPPTGGSASFDGTFEVGLIDFIIQSGTRVSGETMIDRGAIALTANFDNGTLTGGGTGLDGGLVNFYLRENVLSVNGTISGTALRGSVTYDGVTGPLRGLVGSNEVIGAFHGHTDNQVHAGGFIAN